VPPIDMNLPEKFQKEDLYIPAVAQEISSIKIL
jgi:hypothetical protein